MLHVPSLPGIGCTACSAQKRQRPDKLLFYHCRDAILSKLFRIVCSNNTNLIAKDQQPLTFAMVLVVLAIEPFDSESRAGYFVM
jgi:hypothetical protein